MIRNSIDRVQDTDLRTYIGNLTPGQKIITVQPTTWFPGQVTIWTIVIEEEISE